MIYLYDGSFEGLLTAIYEAYYLKDSPEKMIAETDFVPNLLDITVTIETNTEKADKVYNSIREKISPRSLRNVYYAFLSEDPEVGSYIYRYLRLGWKMGKRIDEYLLEERVLAVHQLCQKVNKERHRMLGLVRFQQLQGDYYYATIDPDHNILALIAPHFQSRMGDQSWMIRDEKRDIAAVCFKGQWVIREIARGFIPRFDGEESQYQHLWREYFSSISIEERFNPSLQKKNMPKRYWKNLVEK